MAVKFMVTTPIDVEVTTNTTQYTANDVVGGQLTFTPSTAKTGTITGVSIADDDNEGAEYVLWLFDTVTTAIANNAAFAPVIADLTALMGRVTIASANYVTVNSLKTAYVPLSQPIPFSGAFGGYLVATGTPTFASGKKAYIRLHITGES